MPLGFWNDRGDERYRAAYFSRYPDVWTHGDWCELTERGTMIVYGRSDATLNPGGVRIGTAEIYSVVERIDEVEESVAIGQLWPPDNPTDTRVVLFVKLRAGYTLDQPLEDRIRFEIRRHASPRHVPARIVQVPDIPRTKNGKVVELAVKAVVHGMPVGHTEALANPDALDYFKELPDPHHVAPQARQVRLDADARRVGQRDASVGEIHRKDFLAQRIRVGVDLGEALTADRRQKMHRCGEANAAGEPMRAERDTARHSPARHCAAAGDPAPFADVGLHEAQISRVDRRGEIGLATDVLAGRERSARVGEESLPCVERFVGGDRLLDPVRRVGQQFLDARRRCFGGPRLVRVHHDGRVPAHAPREASRGCRDFDRPRSRPSA